MGDPRNWTPRKLDSVRRANEAADRERLREVTLYAHHAHDTARVRVPNWFRMHPCDTFRVFRLQVTAECMGCRQRWPITATDLDDTPWAHRHWPAVMQELACPACGSCPSAIIFSSGSGEVGAISTWPEFGLHAHQADGVNRTQAAVGAPDPFAQHDDGGCT